MISGEWWSGNRLTIALNEFQTSLSPEQRKHFNEISSGTPAAEDVISLSEEIDKKNSTRRSRVWVQRTSGVLNSVQQYSAIVDTFIQANPTIAALVWGSVKFVILAAINFSDYFESLSRRFEQFSKYCPRLREYEKLFGDSVRVRDALSDFYAVVVVFCTKALGGIQEKAIKRFVKSLSSSFKDDFGLLEQNLSAARDEVDAEIRLASEQKAHGCRELQQIEYRKNERYRSGYQVEVQENRIHRSLEQTEITANRLFRSLQLVGMAKQNQLQLQKIVREEERYRIRLHRMVCNYDYTWNLRMARMTRCPDTGLWLFERPEFKGWLEGTLPNCLWCYGTTGCGKTVITGHVIDHLMTTRPSEESRAVAYYFFDFRRKESLSILTFLRSILHQVLRIDKISPEIQRRLEEIFIGTTGTREPDLIELQGLITDVCATNIQEEVFLVVDGIDEADEGVRKIVLQFLKDMQLCARVKLFAAGQPEVDIKKVVRCVTISITPRELEDDIRTFIDVQVEKELNGVLSVHESGLVDKIKDVLAWKAQGMFLWVDLQIKAIRGACEDDGTADRVPQLLDDLPRDIQEIYSRALQKLLCSGAQRTEITRNVFRWVICARRPMNINELEEAATIKVGQKSWKEPPIKLSWPTLSKLCGNLLAFDDSDGSIFLAHHSVLQFLQSCMNLNIPSIDRFHFQVDEADRYLGELCVTYLNFIDFKMSLTTTHDSSTLRPLARPLELGLHVLPGLKKLYSQGSSSRSQRPLDKYNFSIEDQLRAVMSTSRAAKSIPQFILLDYCRTNWYHHCAVFSPDDDDVRSFVELQKLVLRKQLPFRCHPWDPPDRSSPYPYWSLFYWACPRARLQVPGDDFGKPIGNGSYFLPVLPAILTMLIYF
ncbi:hypothetical protein BDD12DRAFT_977932 [Trichophaea hybrida]|nr:hypothetical protein BDD12DRAFT_977932 [Trichophaea hybrida]